MRQATNPCVGLYAREFWLEGNLVSPCCVLFLLFENGECLSASYNDENCIWEVKGQSPAPDFSTPEGDSAYYYPYRSHFPIEVGNIGELSTYKVHDRNLLVFCFSRGLRVELLYDQETEHENIRVHA